jgi:hypothetical protein
LLNALGSGKSTGAEEHTINEYRGPKIALSAVSAIPTPSAVSTIAAAAATTTTTTTTASTTTVAAPAATALASTTTTTTTAATTRCTTTAGTAIQCHDVFSLRALLALADVKLDLLTFLELPEPAALDRREVDEAILAAVVRRYETVTLLCVEPLHYPCRAHRAGVLVSSR